MTFSLINFQGVQRTRAQIYAPDADKQGSWSSLSVTACMTSHLPAPLHCQRLHRYIVYCSLVSRRVPRATVMSCPLLPLQWRAGWVLADAQTLSFREEGIHSHP